VVVVQGSSVSCGCRAAVMKLQVVSHPGPCPANEKVISFLTFIYKSEHQYGAS
jgi:hypothetical protein